MGEEVSFTCRESERVSCPRGIPKEAKRASGSKAVVRFRTDAKVSVSKKVNRTIQRYVQILTSNTTYISPQLCIFRGIIQIVRNLLQNQEMANEK